MAIEPTETSLKSRSYIGLVLSQFLAAFNDQAIHFVAIFYAGDMLVRFVGAKGIDEKAVVTIVTACFISPFFFFSPLAGVLADKFSKRTTIVCWKYAEIGITGLALVGFLLPHTAAWGWASAHTLAAIGASLVVAAVFMMGTHSAFFVPAKYGIMPEILHPSILSRGNGLLEGTSFTANILGTAFGGFCYDRWKSTLDASGNLVPGHEWRIGVTLVGLALIGTFAAQLISRIPAAAPDRRLDWEPWIPLRNSLKMLRSSRPLVLATVGIAFFTFMTLFLRQTLIFQGETAKQYHEFLSKQPRHHTPADLDITDPANVMPQVSSSQQRAELRVAMLVAIVGLGVGIGCATAGYLSGHRIELGLVPGWRHVASCRATGSTSFLAWVITTHRVHSDWPTQITLVFVGIAAGLYIVPLYTLLQHRAPKESKGSLVAMSNFLNVSGGLLAIAVFYLLTATMQSLYGVTLREHDVNTPALAEQFRQQLEAQLQIPRLLLVAGSLISLLMVVLLCWARPDFLLRTVSWFRLPGRRHLEATGLTNIPGTGPLLLATNCHSTSEWTQVMAAIDRGARALRPSDPASGYVVDDSTLEWIGRRLGLFVGTPTDCEQAEWDRVLDSGHQALAAGNLVGLALDVAVPECAHDRLLHELRERHPCGVLPVRFEMKQAHGLFDSPDRPRPTIVIGRVLPLGVTAEQIRAAMAALEPGGRELEEPALH